MTAPHSAAARIVAELRQRLKSEHSLEDGDEALETTLEGASDLPELLAAMMRDAIQALDQQEAIEKRVNILKARAVRLEVRYHQLRSAVTWALQEAGWKRIPADILPEMSVTISMREESVADIPNENAVPNEFRIFQTTSRPNRALITERLKAGDRFDFAHLPNPKPVLTIRSK